MEYGNIFRTLTFLQEKVRLLENNNKNEISNYNIDDYNNLKIKLLILETCYKKIEETMDDINNKFILLESKPDLSDRLTVLESKPDLSDRLTVLESKPDLSDRLTKLEKKLESLINKLNV